MDKKLRERMKDQLEKGLGCRLSFHEVAEIVSSEEPSMGVGCCWSDRTSAAIVLRCQEMGFDPAQICGFLSLVTTRTYEVLSDEADKRLITAITDGWRRQGKIPSKTNMYEVIDWLDMLRDDQKSQLNLPHVPEEFILALNRTRLSIETRRKKDGI